jgi:DNA-binding transcriptional LysR family regulator
VCTRPANPVPRLEWHPVATEPFAVVSPVDAKGDRFQVLLKNLPFIWFNRKSWSGRKIEEQLTLQKIVVNATVEIASLEAILNLVGEGLDVSIVPVCGALALLPNPGPRWSGVFRLFQVGGLVSPADLTRMTGDLLPIALWGRSSV